jgi:hypothetical protein
VINEIGGRSWDAALLKVAARTDAHETRETRALHPKVSRVPYLLSATVCGDDSATLCGPPLA